MNIKSIPTESLVAELLTREGVKKVAAGPYKTHRLEAKYNQDAEKEITSDIVLLVNLPNQTGPFSAR